MKLDKYDWFQIKWTAILGTIVLSLNFCSCTISADRYKPSTDYPDASTPAGLRVPGTLAGHDEYNGGLIDDITLNGRAYNVVTPNLAAKVQKWQGNQNGFVKVDYRDHNSYFPFMDGAPSGYFVLWAIDKGAISAWVHSAN